MGALVMPKLDPSGEISVVTYSNDLIRRIIAVAATRYLPELRTPASWGDLFRSELSRLDG